MSTANAELKSTVRNWITSRIRSTNDDYLASNDYVKFHRIEEEGATSGVYSTILKDTDTSGQIEFVDTLDVSEQGEKIIVLLDVNGEICPIENSSPTGTDDILVESYPWSAENEQLVSGMVSQITGMDETQKQAALDALNQRLDKNTLTSEQVEEFLSKYEKMMTAVKHEVRDTSSPDKNMKVVGLNMFNDAINTLDDGIASLNSSISSLTSSTADTLKDYLKFSSIEASTEDEGVYHTVLSNDKAAGQLEFIDTLDEAEKGDKVIVFLDANEEVVPMFTEEGEFLDSMPWSAEMETETQGMVEAILAGRVDEMIADGIENFPENADKFNKVKTITHIGFRYSNPNPDKKIKVVGQNMFNAAINSLNSSISSINSSTTDTLKDYIKFSNIEASTEDEGIYHTVLSNDKAAGQLEFIDTLDDAEKGDKVIVLLDKDGEVVPFGPKELFALSVPWTAEKEASMPDLLASLAEDTVPDKASEEEQELYAKYLSAESYDVRYINTNPDKKIKVVGKNMFDSSVNSLTSRISELEQRLAILISAFEEDAP